MTDYSQQEQPMWYTRQVVTTYKQRPCKTVKNISGVHSFKYHHDKKNIRLNDDLNGGYRWIRKSQ